MAAKRHPTALLPKPLARTLGFGLLALLGAAEWQRMIDGAGLLGALGWVGAGVLVAEAVRAAGGVPARWRTAAAALATFVGLVLAMLVSGLEPRLLAPAHWSELAIGIGRGLEALSGVTLPYVGPDPWPEITVSLGGTLLVAAAAALVSWPRQDERGFPFLALALLLVLVVTPVTAIGSSRSLVLGAALAFLTVCFLWLERIPLRPGVGAVALGALALAGALPLSAAVDREGPWFDYRAWAEGIGTPAPVRFNWEHTYRPITWPREGRELLRIKSDEPHYWKLENLNEFDGERWTTGWDPYPFDEAPEADLDPGWQSHAEWTGRARVTVRGLRSTALAGAGTTLAVDAGRTRVLTKLSPGTWQTPRELAAGNSYEVRFHAPRPQPGQLGTATSGADSQQPTSLELVLPLLEPRFPERADLGIRPLTWAKLEVRPFAEQSPPVANYVRRETTGSGEAALRNSPYRRTWRLAQRLKQGATSPYEYARRIDAYLGGNGFRYDERPPAPPAGRAPLDAFLFDTKAGYCQHFSGAMALLLRLGGVPARVATGFSPGGFNRQQGEWVVRDRDAHSWVEAWYDGIGWVTFDPTPAETPARSLIAAIKGPGESGATDPAADAAGGLSGRSGAVPGARRPGGASGELDRSVAAGETASKADNGPGALPLATGCVALLLMLALVLLLRRRARTRHQPVSMDRAVADLAVALRRAGRPVAPGTTLSELERRLGARREGSAYLTALRVARYGPADSGPTVEQRRAFRRELAAGLGWSGQLRAWWALPPQWH